MMAGDLACELELALAGLVDQLVNRALRQEAADLYLALLAKAMGTVFTFLMSVVMP